MSQRNSDKTLIKKTSTAATRPSVGNVSVFAQNSLDVSNLVLNNQAISIQPESLSYLNVTTAGVAQANKAVIVNNSNNIENLGDISTGELYVDGDLVTGVVNRGATVSDSIYMNNIQPGVSSPEKILSASPTGEITANVQSDIVKYNGGELKGKKTLDTNPNEHRDFVDIVNFFVTMTASNATFGIGQINTYIYENIGDIIISHYKSSTTSHTFRFFQNPYVASGGSFSIGLSSSTETHSYQCAYDPTFTRYMVPFITVAATARLNIYVSPNTNPSTWTSVAWTVVTLPTTTTGGSDMLTPAVKWSSLLNQYVIFYVNTLYGSTNGTDWTALSTTPATMGFVGKMIVHPNYLLVVNTGTTTYFTTNGTSWTSKVFTSAPMTETTDFPSYLPEIDVIIFNGSNVITASTFLSLGSSGVGFATATHPTLNSNITFNNLTYRSDSNSYVWNTNGGRYNIYNISNKLLYSGIGSYHSGYINFGSFNTTTFASTRCWRYTINLNKPITVESYVDINPETFLNFENKNRAIIRDFEWAPLINKYVAIGFVDDAYNTAFYGNVCIYHSDDLETFTFVADTGSSTVNKLCLNLTNGYIYIYTIGNTTLFSGANYGLNGVVSISNGSSITGIYYIPSIASVAAQITSYIIVTTGSTSNPFSGISIDYSGYGASGICIFNPDNLDLYFTPGTLFVNTDLISMIVANTRAINFEGGTTTFYGGSGYRNNFPGNVSFSSSTTGVIDSIFTSSYKRISPSTNVSLIKANISGSVIAGRQYSNIEYIQPLGIYVAVRVGSNHLDTERIVYSYDCRTWIEPASNSISAVLINNRSSTVKYDSNSGYMYVLGANGFFKTIHSMKKLNLEESMLSKTQLSHFYARDNSGLELFPFSTIKSSDNTNVFNNGLSYSKGVYVTCCTNKLSVGSKIFNMVDTTLTGNWTSIASSLTHFIVAGNGQIAVSSNLGVSFSPVTSGISSYYWNFISYSDQVGRWAMCSDDAFAFSTDGTTWTVNEVTGGSWKSIKYSNGFWLAVGLNKIAYVNNTNATTNGAVTVVNISGDWRDSAFGGQWIITGYGKTALSTNINSLAAWTTLTAANNKNYNSVVYVEGLRQFVLVGEHTAVYVQMTKVFYQPANAILINTGESAWGVMKQCIWSDRYQAVICVGAGRSIVGSRIVGSGLDNSYFNVNSQYLSGYDNTVANSYLSISDYSVSPSTADGQLLIRTNTLSKPFISFKNNTDGLIASMDNKSTTSFGLTVPKCLSLEYTKFLKLGTTTLAYTPTNLAYLSINQLGTSTPNTYITTDISGDVAAAGVLNIGGLVLGNKIYSNTTPIIMQSVTDGVVSAGKACKLDSSKNLTNVNVLSVDYLNIGIDTFECVPVDTSLSIFAHTQSSTECAENTVNDACYHSDLDIYVASSNMTEFTNATNVERHYLLFSKDGINWNKCFTGLQANTNKIIPLYADATKNHFFINTTTVTTYIGFVIFATNTANNIGKIFFTPDLVNFYPLNTTGAASTHDTLYLTTSTIFLADGVPAASIMCYRNATSTSKFLRAINSGTGIALSSATNITATDFKYALNDNYSSTVSIFGLVGNTTFRVINDGSGYATIATLSTVTANAMVYANALNGVSTNWDYIIACNSGKILHGGPITGLQVNGGTELVIDATSGVHLTCCEYNFTTKRFLIGSNTGKIYISNAGSKTVWTQVTTPSWMNGQWNGIRSIGSKGFLIWHDDNGNSNKKNSKICRVDENNTFQLMYQSFERTLGVGCYGAGKYVIPDSSSSAERIMYSDDGMNWKYTLNVSETFSKVVFMPNINMFVAMSSRNVYSSSNGVDWTLTYTHPSGSAIYSSSLYASGRNLLVLTYRNVTTQNVITSSDLSQWNTYDFTSYNNIWYSAYSPLLDRFVFSPSSGSNPAFYTTNFTTFNSCVSTDTDTSTVPLGRNMYWFQSSNEFYIGSGSILWQSYDGISWRRIVGFVNYDINANPANPALAGVEKMFTYVPNVGDITVNGSDPDGSFLVNVSNGMYKPIAVLGGGIKGDDYSNLIYNSDDNKVLVYKNSTGSRKGEYFQIVDLEEHKQKNNKEIAIDYVDKVYGDRLSLDNYVGTSNIRTLMNSTLDGGSANKTAILSSLGTWAAIASSNASNVWQSICWSPQLSIFVAVASSGTNRVMTSTDGTSWTAVTSSGESNSWQSVCWSSLLGLFVAVANSGSNRVMTSSNGTSWTSSASATEANNWQSVCWSPELELFVAVATSGTNRVMTSTNGTSWTARASATEANTWISVCWSPQLSLFVAVSTSGTNRVMTSTNGTSWTARASSAETNSWYSVCWSSTLGLFAAVSTDGTNRVMISSNGLTWETRASGSDSNNWYHVHWSDHLRLFISVGAGTNRIMTSSNGMNWTANASPTEAVFWYSSCSAPEINTVVGVGSANALSVMRLFQTKTVLDPTDHISNLNEWYSMCWSPSLNLFVAVSFGNTNNLRVATSPDGIEWTGRNASNNRNNWYGVCWSPELSLFVAVASSGTYRVMTSTNGITWIPRLSAVETNSWTGVCWAAELGSGLFVSVASSGTNRVMTSPDGITWTARTSSGETNSWNRIAWSPTLGLLVAVASNSSTTGLMTSDNGTSWTNRTIPAIINLWQDVAWSPSLGMFAVVGAAATNRVLTSIDGLNWTARTPSDDTISYRAIIWASGLNMFVATASDGTFKILTSYDGINWYVRRAADSTSNPWRTIAYSPSLNRLVLGSSQFSNSLISIDNLNNSYSTISNSVSNAYDIYNICWSPDLSLFVALVLNSAQRVITSSNAITWTARTPSATANQWISVCWSPQLTLFVAVANSGTNRVMTSSNGTSWSGSASATEANAWVGICWSPDLGLFVSVANTGTNRVMTSSNGTSWTAVASAGESNGWRSVCWSPALGLFVAVASTGTNRVMTSSNGSSWTAVASSNESNGWCSVCWSPELGIFVAVAITGTNRVMTSDNGTSWTSRTPPLDTNEWVSVSWSAELGLFAAVAQGATTSNRVMFSNNGINWTARVSGQDSQPLYSVCWASSLSSFVAVGGTTTNKVQVFEKPTIGNGTDLVVTFNTVLIANFWEEICWSTELGLFVGIASTGTRRIATSRDGVNWTARTSATEANSWTSICWSPALGLFVGVAASGTNRVMTSSNGISWTAVTSSGESNGWWGVCWSPALGLFVAVANTGTNRVMTSSNGSSWTAVASATETNNWRSVCWSPQLSLFVAVSTTGTNRVMTSSNGTSWTAVASATEANAWIGVCWSPELGLFAAISNSGTNRVMTSPDGTNWTARVSAGESNSWYKIIWVSSINSFIAVASSGTNTIMISKDGINWVARQHSTGLYAIGYSPVLNTIPILSAGATTPLVYYVSTIPTITLSYIVGWDVFWSKYHQRFIAYKKVDPTTNDTQIYLSKDGYSWTYDAVSYTGINAASRLKAVTSSCEVPFLDAIYTCRNTAFVISLSPLGVVQTAVTGIPTANALYYSSLLKCLIIGSSASNLIALCIPTKTGTISNIITYTLPATITVNQILTCTGNHLIILSGSTSSYYYSTNMNVFSTGTLPSTGVWKFDARTVRGYSKRIVGVNTAGVIIYSDNGISWTTAVTYTPSTRSFVNVKYIQEFDAFVAVDSISKTNAAVYSFDGITWSDITFSSSVSLCDAAYSTSNDNFVFLSTGTDLVTTIVTLPKSAAGGNIIPYDTRSSTGLASNIFNLNSKGGIYTGTFTSNTFNSAETENVPLLALHSNSAYKPTNSSWTIQSDVRIKHDIENADLDQCFDNVKSLDLKHYNWKEEFLTQTGETDRSRLGWIAQDVEQILPKSIVEMGSMYGLDNLKTLNQDQIVATMYGAVQKLMQKYEALQNELDGLE